MPGIEQVPHDYLLSELVKKKEEFLSEEPNKVTLGLKEVQSQPFQVSGLSRTWAQCLTPTKLHLSQIQQPQFVNTSVLSRPRSRTKLVWCREEAGQKEDGSIHFWLDFCLQCYSCLRFSIWKHLSPC